MEDAETLELYELPYSDLQLLSSSSLKSSSSTEELDRLDLVRTTIMEALGPTGPGLLSLTGVPNAAILRRSLPLARNLALLDPENRKRILKEQKLGSDVPLKNPERNVSSFAMQLKFGQNLCKEHYSNSECEHREFGNLGINLKKLGFCMMDIGLCLARVCDHAIGGQELEQSLLESCAAKGRLIHYHSVLDGQLLQEQDIRNKRVDSKRERRKLSNGDPALPEGNNFHSNLWQQWHYDYGIFTVLTAPLFLQQAVEEEDQNPEPESLSKECDYPNGHTYLQIFDPNKNCVFKVKASPESFIIQVGESAEVISKGKLRATLHSVGRPGKLDNLSRETFVVFLQPAWDKVLYISDYLEKCSNQEETEEKCLGKQHQSNEEIQKIVPQLSSRLKDGMTFADFSRETTKQYYGGSGLQSNRGGRARKESFTMQPHISVKSELHCFSVIIQTLFFCAYASHKAFVIKSVQLTFAAI